MIEIFRLKIIEDEKEREIVEEIIRERESYYEELFAGEIHPPRIKVTFEGVSPLTVRILFSPIKGRTVVISESGYGSADALIKHAFKKLRRKAKNHFIKTKRRHRE